MRNGGDVRLPRDREKNACVHIAPVVYREMLLQVARDYAGLPDPRTLSVDDILFFYNGLRPELRKHTHQSGK